MISRVGRSPLGAMYRSPLGVLTRPGLSYAWEVDAELIDITASAADVTGLIISFNQPSGIILSFDPPIPLSSPFIVSTQELGPISVPSPAVLFTHGWHAVITSAEAPGVPTTFVHGITFLVRTAIRLQAANDDQNLPEVDEFEESNVSNLVDDWTTNVRLAFSTLTQAPDPIVVEKSYSGTLSLRENNYKIQAVGDSFLVANNFGADVEYSARFRFTFTPIEQ